MEGGGGRSSSVDSLEPQTQLATHPGLSQPSLALQSGAHLPPQRAVGPPPHRPGPAVGESTLRPTCSPLATYRQTGQGT